MRANSTRYVQRIFAPPLVCARGIIIIFVHTVNKINIILILFFLHAIANNLYRANNADREEKLYCAAKKIIGNNMCEDRKENTGQ